MDSLSAYRQQQAAGPPRIDLLILLYNKAVERLEQAIAFLKQDDKAGATQAVTNARVLVGALASGVDLRHGELPRNLLRLYEYVTYQIGLGDLENLESAVQILYTLKEALEQIRPEAAALERSGQIPSAGSGQVVQELV
jgi:flagellar protein FliS